MIILVNNTPLTKDNAEQLAANLSDEQRALVGKLFREMKRAELKKEGDIAGEIVEYIEQWLYRYLGADNRIASYIYEEHSDLVSEIEDEVIDDFLNQSEFDPSIDAIQGRLNWILDDGKYASQFSDIRDALEELL